MDEQMIGRFVIVRCLDAGVHAGILAAYSGREATLTESRRLWYWRPADGMKWLSGVAVAGLAPDSRIGEPLPRIILTETCEIILCTDKAAASISGFPAERR